MRREDVATPRRHIRQVLQSLRAQARALESADQLIDRAIRQQHRGEVAGEEQLGIVLVLQQRVDRTALVGGAAARQPFHRGQLQRGVAPGQRRGQQRQTRRMRNARQRAERCHRHRTAAVVRIQLGERLHTAVIAQRADRGHRRHANRRLAIVERRHQRVAHRDVGREVAHTPPVQPRNHLHGRRAQFALRHADRRAELRGRLRQQPTTIGTIDVVRQQPEGVQRLDRHARVVVAQHGAQRRQHRQFHRARMQHARALLEQPRRRDVGAHLDQQADAFARHQRHRQVQVDLRRDGVSLDGVFGIVQRAGQRHRRLGIGRLLQRTHGAQAHVRVLVAEFRHHLLEGHGRRRCLRPRRPAGQQEPSRTHTHAGDPSSTHRHQAAPPLGRCEYA